MKQPPFLAHLVIASGAFLGTVACGPVSAVTPMPTPIQVCSTADGTKVSEKLGQIASEWDDALKLASSTSRIALATPVSDLQRIRRDLQAQTWPDCATRAKTLLTGSMDSTINGYLEFMRQESSSSADVTRGGQLMDQFSQELLYLSGTPRPAPTAVPPAAALPMIGKTATLRSGAADASNNVVIATSATAMTDFLRARSDGTLDMNTVQSMSSAGKLWRVDAETHVRVQNAQATENGLIYQVQVADGPSAGGQGWVEASSLA